MSAIFVKELRENLKWAGVIFGVPAVMFAHEMRDANPLLLFRLSGQDMVWLAPLAGLLLGVVQSLFETRADNWAFVVHRPVDRLKIFVAKCAAGLVLLYAALGVPCVLVSIWTARPGNVPMPFQMRMTLPFVTDLLNAGCYYFVGILLTLRRAHWFGSRVLVIGVALLASGMTFLLIAEFWQAALILLSVQCLGAISAWGAFGTSGAFDGAPITRLSLGAMIFPGALAVGMFLAGLTETFYTVGRWQYFQIDRDGNPVRITQTIDRDQRGWSLTDPNGQPIAKYANVDLDDPQYANLFVRYSAFLVDESHVPWPMNVEYLSHAYRSPTPGVLKLGAVAPDGVRLRNIAIYNVEDRVIDLYDPVTDMLIGTVGPDGYADANAAPTSRFPGTPHDLSSMGKMHVMPFDSVVYWIELDKRRVRPIITAPADEPVVSAAEVGPAKDPNVVIATRKRLVLLHPDGKPIFSAAMTFDLNKDYLQPAILPGNHHLILDAGSMPGDKAWFHRVVEFADDGSMARSTDLPQLPAFRGPKLPETALFGALFPVGLRPIMPNWVLDDVFDIRSEQFSNVFDDFMIGSAILCAAMTLLLSRRLGFDKRRTLGWTIANVLLGPAGVGVMLSITSWPPREICPACGAKRFSWRRECSHCAAALPPPAQDGREIFEPIDMAQPAM